MPKQSDLFFAGGAGAIAQSVLQGEYQILNTSSNANVTTSWTKAHEITVNKTGEYNATYVAGFQADATVRFMQASFYVNGVQEVSSVINATVPNNDANEYAVSTNTIPLSLTAGDTVELWVKGEIAVTNGLDNATISITPKVSEGEAVSTYTQQEMKDFIGNADDTTNGLVPRYQKVAGSIATTGTFNRGSYKAERIGDRVTITIYNAGWSGSLSVIDSASGFIPSDYRPQGDAYHIADARAAVPIIVVTSVGKIRLLLRAPTNLNSASAQTDVTMDSANRTYSVTYTVNI